MGAKTNFMKQNVLILLAFLLVASCSDSGSNSNKKSVETVALIDAPEFNADQAYDYVQKQVDFGPRVPNTEAHKKASAWFKETLEGFGAKVYMQEWEDYTYDGTKVQLTNVIASFNPGVKKRIMLSAHWDTRPFADHDKEDHMGSLDGANDGGSGVGVLLEVARVIGQNEGPKVGVDIILFDGEDWGDGDSAAPPPTNGNETWWCLGSQYWAKNKHIPNYSAYYGILLDMVGAPDATFYYDANSQANAGRVLKKVWDRGIALGHEEYFIPKMGFRYITDDHVYINKLARIPTIDIIDYRPPGKFTPVWHTTKDDMSGIDKTTLGVVGEVVLSMLWNE